MEAMQYVLSSYKGVPSVASNALKRVAKRYSCLVQPLLPFVLAAIAGLPLPSPQELRAILDQPDRPMGAGVSLDLGFMKELCQRAVHSAGLDATTAPVSAAGDSFLSK